ncbi:uncharacterized protein LOC116619408 [Nematostella vectensis]|uniref:uncharacterized protein LOC116619408 n=1 Tax=Nematostella vectensis TaxID=45351 RepID=UPI00207783B0|nr:uncharacterized protein LOC116619408 [Nematostella vectensis]
MRTSFLFFALLLYTVTLCTAISRIGRSLQRRPRQFPAKSHGVEAAFARAVYDKGTRIADDSVREITDYFTKRMVSRDWQFPYKDHDEHGFPLESDKLPLEYISTTGKSGQNRAKNTLIYIKPHSLPIEKRVENLENDVSQEDDVDDDGFEMDDAIVEDDKDEEYWRPHRLRMRFKRDRSQHIRYGKR